MEGIKRVTEPLENMLFGLTGNDINIFLKIIQVTPLFTYPNHLPTHPKRERERERVIKGKALLTVGYTIFGNKSYSYKMYS